MTRTTLLPTEMMLAAPLKVAAGVGVVVALVEDVVETCEAVADDVVVLPAGKGAELAVVEVVGGGAAATTGVVEVEVEVVVGDATGVEEVEVVDVVRVLLVLDVLEVDEAASGELATPEAPPVQGNVTM